MRSYTKCKKWRHQNQRKHLPSSQKNRLQLDFTIPRKSDGTTVFLIEILVDWCLRHAWETVRSHTKCKKWWQHKATKHVPSSQKTQLRLEFSIPRQSNSTTVFLIEIRVDWCLRLARETVRSYTNCRKWRRQRTESNESLSIVTKKPIATQVANSTPIQWHHRLPHQILCWLMPMKLRRRG
jgi:hypothetical protein